MDKQSWFLKELKKDIVLSGCDEEMLLELGDFLGRHQQLFKKLYKAYKMKGNEIELIPDLGAPVHVLFDRQEDEVAIKRLNNNVNLSIKAFLHFCKLIDVCFIDTVSLGSVIRLDMDYFSEMLQEKFHHKSDGLAMIVDHQVILNEEKKTLVDYVALLWPFSGQGNPPIVFLSTFMIQEIVHRGMRNEFEQTYLQRLKENNLHNNRVSLAFETEDSIEEIKKFLEENPMEVEENGKDS